MSSTDIFESTLSGTQDQSLISQPNELEIMYQNLSKQEKNLNKQLYCIKRSMKTLQEKIEINDNKDKNATINKNENQNKPKPNNATERLKFRDYTRKPTKMINFLEDKIGMEIDLYFLPTKPVSTEILQNRNKKVTYKNGDYSITHKTGIYQIFHNETQIIHFTNGDIQQKFSNGIIVHEYNENGSIEAVIPGSVRWITFRDGQIEKITDDGKKIIKYPDNRFVSVPKDLDFEPF
ncbi:hypothetical protein TVAG_083620 [Trichomonas vaginalis G3]|uniref:Centromere protein J C-terminal domain-containing protein n=1 Tax=Trichomonas vaginalis (strain ATCC PRA-98 / G3) TaxID=412133 RepID=A2DM88_TRIV3|nr:centromere protein J family [Trichomonas vaginalis G3]EAY18508.1 hypothetical protein TVAG_083620 [Trichomonas vaginalis G3]KAI5489503.1 centromere protein J family [Trichomonas vaginalis G3]|eukprot:XP_001579494.1 hypothetical protein [Trichomonas vaginalis G3]